MFLVCGEALFDVFVGAGSPAAGIGLEARAGGSPYNVAIGLARLGIKAALLTGLSRDVLGEMLAQQLAREGVDTGYLVRSGRRTTLSLVGIDAKGHPAYTFYGVGSADCSLTDADLPALDANVTGLHFGSYSIAVAPTADAFATLAARAKQRFISLDPNVRPTIEPDMAVWRARIEALLPSITLVKASTEDIAALYPGQNYGDVARQWLIRGPAMVVVTDGSQGAHIWTESGALHHAAPQVCVVDTVGAGDLFQAALLATLTEQDRMSRPALRALTPADAMKMLDIAMRAAAITCTRRGADLPYRHDLDGSGALRT